MVRQVAGWLLLLALAFAAPASAAPSPGGIYAIINADVPAQNTVAAQALQTPGVDGLLIHLHWQTISPAKMQYDWTALDRVVQIAVAANKTFEIGIETGSLTPAWVTDPAPTGVGAAHATFTLDEAAAEQCSTFTMAAPWDPAYLAAFG
ncbi:MAG: hypothetical protein ABUL43_00185, partial [Hyphomicrobium sp.]